MNYLTYMFFICALMAGILSFLVVWSRRSWTVKLITVGVLGFFLSTGYISMLELLGRPKPVDLEFFRQDAKEADVLGQLLIPDVAIHLYLRLPGDRAPRAYSMAWNQKLAEQVQDAWEKAQKEGTGMKMSLPFERSYDQHEPKFYALPQVALPEKVNPNERNGVREVNPYEEEA